MYNTTYVRNLLVPSLKILLDAIAIESAILFSFYLRFQSPLQQIFPVTKGYPPFRSYLITSFILTFAFLIIFSVLHSYRSRYFSTYTQDIPVILKGCFLGIVFAMSGAFLYRGFSYSRLTFLLIYLNTGIFLLMIRYMFHQIRKQLIRTGMGIQKIILVGSSDIIPHFIAQFNRDVHHYLQISGYCSDREANQVNIPFLGMTRELDTIIQTIKPEGLLLTFNAHDHNKILDILSILEGKNIEILFVPDILDMITSHTGILEISGMPVYRLKSTPLSGWQGLTKRVFDFMVSGIGLFFLFPLFLIIAVLVKLGSKGPVFYKQNRIGLDGREFNMLKFRSMIGEAEKNTGPVWAKKNDPRVTTVGRFLRRTSLDELPQLINVLKGEMSLVGPRPERKKFVYEFQQSIPKYTERHRVRSGVTGWAQVNGLRGQSPIEKRTQYDVYYIENWSLWFDIKIILMTFMAIIKGENAY